MYSQNKCSSNAVNKSIIKNPQHVKKRIHTSILIIPPATALLAAGFVSLASTGGAVRGWAHRNQLPRHSPFTLT